MAFPCNITVIFNRIKPFSNRQDDFNNLGLGLFFRPSTVRPHRTLDSG
jgi:hypothetical protein